MTKRMTPIPSEHLSLVRKSLAVAVEAKAAEVAVPAETQVLAIQAQHQRRHHQQAQPEPLQAVSFQAEQASHSAQQQVSSMPHC